MPIINIRFSEADLARLDELRPANCSRSSYVKLLLRQNDPVKVEATHEESLQLLAESARIGSVPAQVALERALRQTLKKGDEVGDAIQALLARGE